MQRNEVMSLFCAGILVLGARCAMLENGGTGATHAVEPEPGTRAYFEQMIRGSYALDGGELVKIYPFSGTAGMPAAPGVIRPSPGYSSFYVQQLEGRALQVISNNLVVLGKSVTNLSGAVTSQRTCVVSLVATQPPQQGEPLKVLARSDGSYTYTDGTRSGTLTAYREVPEPTFEDYLKIYERDTQAAAVPPIISVERVVVSRPLPPGVVRPASSMPSTQATPSPVHSSTPQTSYRDRMKERLKAQEEQKQETDRKEKEELSKRVVEALRKQME